MHPAKPNLRQLFEQAIDAPPLERAKLLREVQFVSPLLFMELRKLLVAHEGSDAIFDQEGGLWAQLTPRSLVGSRFGSYVIESEIAEGGMGMVYRATRADEAFHKTVAIKIIAGGALVNESAIDAFRRERQILAQLEHPGIARLLDGGATPDGLLFLIMEFVDGLPFDRYLHANQPGIDDILRLVLQICAAVSFAHRNLVVHRDLKPSNIMVDSTGQVKLLDFGIAKVLKSEANDTRTVAVRLTPEFASPEQIRGESISTSSDVYSLGVVLYHALTGGQRPYQPTSNAVPDLLDAVLKTDARRPSSVAQTPFASKLRGELDTIVLKAMAKEPERRYQSVDQLADDIRRYLEGRPILARSDDWKYRTAKFLRRNRLPVAAAALLTISIAAGVVSTFEQAKIARDQREQALLERQRAVNAQAIAEQERSTAERERANSERERQRAEQQAQIALTRSQEAQQSRARALASQSEAEARYQSVRSLATAILFDVNESLRTLPGSGPARQRAVLAALKNLEDLSRRQSSDMNLLEDLATAYEQTAEIMQTLFEDSRQGANFAFPAIEKAIRLRTRIADSRPKDLTAGIQLADTWRAHGNHQLNMGSPASAVQSYATSREQAARFVPAPLATQRIALADLNLCTANLQTNAIFEAVAQCRQAQEVMATLPNDLSPDLPRLRVLTHLRYANSLRKARAIPDAEHEYRVALLLLDPLDDSMAGLLDELNSLLELPGLATDLRVRALWRHAVSLERKKKRDAALDTFEKCFDVSGGAKPALRDVLAFASAAGLHADAIHASRNGQVRQALEGAQKALSLIASNTSAPADLLRKELQAAITTWQSPVQQNPQN